jgi:hypothetical protein
VFRREYNHRTQALPFDAVAKMFAQQIEIGVVSELVAVTLVVRA